MQLLSAAAKPFNREGWVFELKYDGFRALAIKQGGAVKLITRNGTELAPAFPEITAELRKLPDSILDGELVVPDARGVPQFDAVVARSRKGTSSAITAAARAMPAAFLAFDLLAVGNTDLRKRPLVERKRKLAALVRKLQRIKAVEYVEGTGTALFAAIEKMGLEGIVAKRGDSLYRGGRNNDWLKIKTEAGVRKTEKRGDQWFTGPSVETLKRRAARAAAKTEAPAGSKVNSDLGSASRVLDALRGPSDSLTAFLDGHELMLTHLDKILWPRVRGEQPHAITKRDYLAYLLEVAPHMLPHLADRPLTLFVYPDGVAGRRLVEMHWRVKPPDFVQRVKIYSNKSKHDHTYWLCNDAASLLWFANAGVLEFHPWHSRLNTSPDAGGISTVTSGSGQHLDRSVLNYPDYLFFDLDSYIYSGKEEPGAEPEYHRDGFERCRQAALRLRAMLGEMSLRGWVKTSGKTGLHVVVPIFRTLTYDRAREISRHIFTALLKEAPHEFTMDQQVARRRGRTYLDYAMNKRAASMAAPYTVRAVSGA